MADNSKAGGGGSGGSGKQGARSRRRRKNKGPTTRAAGNGGDGDGNVDDGNGIGGGNNKKGKKRRRRGRVQGPWNNGGGAGGGGGQVSPRRSNGDGIGYRQTAEGGSANRGGRSTGNRRNRGGGKKGKRGGRGHGGVDDSAVCEKPAELHALVVHVKESPYDVYVGRPNPSIASDCDYKWGNPFKIGGPENLTRDDVVRMHNEWLTSQPDLVAEAKAELAGKVLACWCSRRNHPKACHADVLAYVANDMPRPAHIQVDGEGDSLGADDAGGDAGGDAGAREATGPGAPTTTS